jgi:hypothetical protein
LPGNALADSPAPSVQWVWQCICEFRGLIERAPDSGSGITHQYQLTYLKFITGSKDLFNFRSGQDPPQDQTMGIQ